MADTSGTILIVDDEPATIELLSDYLGGRRLAVWRAQNLDEALAELEREGPGVVLISLRLGEADGLETVRRIREANVHVGLLVMAEVEDEDRAKQALALGAMDYLLKPIDFDYLNHAVDKALTASAPAVEFAETPAGPAAALTPSGLLYLVRFAHDLGDLSSETAGRLDEHMVRARRSVGLS